MKSISCILILVFVSFQIFSQDFIEEEGMIPVEGGNIWYKIIGNPEKTPIIFIHGGPGGTCCSGIPKYSLLAKEHLLVFYDQLGSGKSDRPTDTTLWRVERFTNEL